MSRSFSDNVKISLYKPGVFLYNNKVAIFIVLGILLAIFITLAIVYRKKGVFLLFVILAVITGLLLVAQIVHVSVKYKNDATTSGSWTEDQLHTHMTDQGLGEQFVNYFDQINPDRVVDVGCGNCGYANILKRGGINVLALDGNDNKDACEGSFRQMDFGESTFHVSPEENLWVYSLEVGEHLPKDKEDTFLDLLTKGDGLIVSWAIPGQGGDGHINEQEASYIRRKIEDRGFVYDAHITKRMRDSARIAHFVHNLMVFHRNVPRTDSSATQLCQCWEPEYQNYDLPPSVEGFSDCWKCY